MDDPGLIERENEELRKKQLALIERQKKEEEERGSGSSSEDSSDEEDPEAKWDVDTILTTHTNTDNHPAIIKTGSRVVRAKQPMLLHK